MQSVHGSRKIGFSSKLHPLIYDLRQVTSLVRTLICTVNEKEICYKYLKSVSFKGPDVSEDFSVWELLLPINASDGVQLTMFSCQKSGLHPTHIRGFKEAISCPRDQQTFPIKDHTADILDSCTFCSCEILPLFDRNCCEFQTVSKNLSFLE